MKTISLLIATGVFSFLMGAAVCYFWFQSRPASAPPAAGDAGTAIAAEASPIQDRGGNQNARATKFETFDIDKDGKLSLAEFSGGRKPAEAEKWFKLRDANNDGFLSREEFLPNSAVPKGR